MRFKPYILAILTAVLFLAGTAFAQERRVPNAAELRLSYAPVVQRVAPAVVNAISAAAGKPMRSLPLKNQGFTFV